MRFFIGALALLVIVATLASPAALLLGLVQFADIRQITGPGAMDPAPAPASAPAPAAQPAKR